MILESVEQGPLIWPSVEVEGVTRLKKYSELSAAEAIEVAKELWERIQLLMQGTSLTKQERECKLYDAFDKFAYQKGEILLTNTSSIVNHNAYMASSSVPQIEYAPMVQQTSEYSPTEARLVVPVFQKGDDPIDVINHMMSFLTAIVTSRILFRLVRQDRSHQDQEEHQASKGSLCVTTAKARVTCPSSAPNPGGSAMQNEYSPPEAGLVVPVFQKGDDPIDAIKHMMSFLTAVVTSRYPATNNQLRTSSNPRQQATINNGRVTIQPIQGRQNFVSAGSSRSFTSGAGGAPGKQRVIVCYNCKEWFKDKVLLVQAQANGQVLQEEELKFLADP
nr:hypothetical protein [Tanacetum cinerariifolium]